MRKLWSLIANLKTTFGAKSLLWDISVSRSVHNSLTEEINRFATPTCFPTLSLNAKMTTMIVDSIANFFWRRRINPRNPILSWIFLAAEKRAGLCKSKMWFCHSQPFFSSIWLKTTLISKRINHTKIFSLSIKTCPVGNQSYQFMGFCRPSWPKKTIVCLSQIG